MDGRRPVKRALVSVSDKTGLVELATALHAAGVRLVSTGNSAARHRRGRHPGHRDRGADRLPGEPGRPGQDPAPARARRPAGRLSATPTHVASWPSWTSSRSSCWSPTSTRSPETVASGAGPDECVEQIDIGGPAMVRAAAKNHANLAVVVDPTRYDWVIEQVDAGGFTLADAARAGRRRLPAHRLLRRRGRLLDGQRAVRRRPRLVPDLAGRDLDPGRAAALRREPAPGRRAVREQRRPDRAGDGEAVARQGDVVQQLHRRRRGLARRARPRAGLRRDHQARQPVRHRDVGSGHRRRAPQGARLRPDQRVRRHHRGEPPGQRGHGRADRGHLHRGRARARPTPTARWTCWPARRTCGSWSPSRRCAAAPSCGRSPAVCSCSSVDTISRRGDDPAKWTLATGEPLLDEQTLADLAFAWRAMPHGQVQRDPAGAPTAPRSASGWAR